MVYQTEFGKLIISIKADNTLQTMKLCRTRAERDESSGFITVSHTKMLHYASSLFSSILMVSSF